MKLDRDIKFKADFIMPICLPEADDKSDILKKDGIVLVEQIFYTNAITLSIANIKFDQPQPLCTR